MNHGLNSRTRRGASVLIALLVFFLAALSGTLVFTMATSNAGRYTHEKEDQQVYFSVASAAKLILNRLGQATIKFISRGHAPESVKDIEILPESKFSDLGLFFSDETFTTTILKQFAYEPGREVLTTEFDLTVDDHAEMGTVHVILLVQGGDFFFQFYVASGESKNYQMTMRVATFFKDGAGNWVADGDDHFKTLEFDVDGATFMNELLTGGVET